MNLLDGLCEFLTEVTEDWGLEVKEPKKGAVELLPDGEGWVKVKIEVEGKALEVSVDAYGKTDAEVV